MTKLRRKPGYCSAYTNIIDKIYAQAAKMTGSKDSGFSQVGQKWTEPVKIRF